MMYQTIYSVQYYSTEFQFYISVSPHPPDSSRTNPNKCALFYASDSCKIPKVTSKIPLHLSQPSQSKLLLLFIIFLITRHVFSYPHPAQFSYPDPAHVFFSSPSTVFFSSPRHIFAFPPPAQFCLSLFTHPTHSSLITIQWHLFITGNSSTLHVYKSSFW